MITIFYLLCALIKQILQIILQKVTLPNLSIDWFDGFSGNPIAKIVFKKHKKDIIKKPTIELRKLMYYQKVPKGQKAKRPPKSYSI